MYQATSTGSTGISYDLDAASVSAGNTINKTSGEVTYAAGWSGNTVITASAAGCNGPRYSSHTVTVTPTVGNPVFGSGTSSIRCIGTGTINYNATATNSTGITYELDAASIGGGNVIDVNTGAVTYDAAWMGSSSITASAAGCNGPAVAIHNVTTNSNVGIPVFSAGANSARCQGSGSLTYTASAAANTGIIYTLDAASISGGNTINKTTGTVIYSAGWSGTSSITATATGCSGPEPQQRTLLPLPLLWEM